MNRDPLSYVAGTNLYQYVANNPLIWADPLGEKWSWRGAGHGLADFGKGLAVGVGIGLGVGLVAAASPVAGAAALYGLGVIGAASFGLSVGEAIAGRTLENKKLSDFERSALVTQVVLSGLTLGVGALISAKSLSTVAENLNRRAPDFVVTPNGEAIIVPRGAAGPYPTGAPGFQYVGGQGGPGIDIRVAQVRIMEANTTQGPRVVYSNVSGQIVDAITGRTVSNSDLRGHRYLIPWRKR